MIHRVAILTRIACTFDRTNHLSRNDKGSRMGLAMKTTATDKLKTFLLILPNSVIRVSAAQHYERRLVGRGLVDQSITTKQNQVCLGTYVCICVYLCTNLCTSICVSRVHVCVCVCVRARARAGGRCVSVLYRCIITIRY